MAQQRLQDIMTMVCRHGSIQMWGMNGLLSRRTGTTSVFYTFDPQGSVVQRLDANENILSTSAYDAWGNQLVTFTRDPFRYCGQWGYYTESETGLLLLTHRYYDPGQGRFVTRDPIGYAGGVNLYGYVGNGSVYGYDFYGLFTVSIGLGGIVSVSEPQSLGVSGWAGANINLTIPTLADILHHLPDQ